MITRVTRLVWTLGATFVWLASTPPTMAAMPNLGPYDTDAVAARELHSTTRTTTSTTTMMITLQRQGNNDDEGGVVSADCAAAYNGYTECTENYSLMFNTPFIDEDVIANFESTFPLSTIEYERAYSCKLLNAHVACQSEASQAIACVWPMNYPAEAPLDCSTLPPSTPASPMTAPPGISDGPMIASPTMAPVDPLNTTSEFFPECSGAIESYTECADPFLTATNNNDKALIDDQADINYKGENDDSASDRTKAYYCYIVLSHLQCQAEVRMRYSCQWQASYPGALPLDCGVRPSSTTTPPTQTTLPPMDPGSLPTTAPSPGSPGTQPPAPNRAPSLSPTGRPTVSPIASTRPPTTAVPKTGSPVTRAPSLSPTGRPTVSPISSTRPPTTIVPTTGSPVTRAPSLSPTGGPTSARPATNSPTEAPIMSPTILPLPPPALTGTPSPSAMPTPFPTDDGICEQEEQSFSECYILNGDNVFPVDFYVYNINFEEDEEEVRGKFCFDQETHTVKRTTCGVKLNSLHNCYLQEAFPNTPAIDCDVVPVPLPSRPPSRPIPTGDCRNTFSNFLACTGSDAFIDDDSVLSDDFFSLTDDLFENGDDIFYADGVYSAEIFRDAVCQVLQFDFECAEEIRAYYRCYWQSNFPNEPLNCDSQPPVPPPVFVDDIIVGGGRFNVGKYAKEFVDNGGFNDFDVGDHAESIVRGNVLAPNFDIGEHVGSMARSSATKSCINCAVSMAWWCVTVGVVRVVGVAEWH